MPRWLKVTLVAFAALVPLALVGVVVLITTTDVRQHVLLAATQLKAATGRELRIGGRVELSLFPRLAIVAEDVSFANAPWGSRPAMAKAKRVEGSIALLPLLRREIEIVRLVLIEPDVLLETDAKGVGNWVLKPPAAAPDGDSAIDWELTSVVVERGTLTWRSGASRETTRLGVTRLRLARPVFSDVNEVELDAAFRGQAFTARGRLGTIRRLVAREPAWPVHLALTTDGARGTLDGTIDWRDRVPVLDLAVKAEAQDLAGIAKLAGLSLDLPTPVVLSAKLAAKDGEQRADPLELTLGRSMVTGRAALRTGGARPHVSARLAAKEIDLSHSGRAAARQPAKRDRLFSEAPLPLDALRRLDGDLEVAVERLVLPGGLPLEAVRTRAVLKGGRLDAQPVAATLGGGRVAGRILLDAAHPTAPLLAVNVDGKGISAEKVAAALGHPGTVSGGNTDVSLRLTGPGESLARFVGWGNGELLAVVGPAKASGAALDAGGGALTSILDTANPSRRNDPHTEVKCAVVRLPVRDGVAVSQRTIAYETTKVNVVVSGEINLRTEALDLAVRPRVKEGISVGSLAQLVRVTGTLAEPAVGIDGAGSARAALSVGGAFLTSGLSLIGEFFYSKMTADPHPCQTALAAPAAAKTTANAPPPAQAGDKEGGFLGAVRRFFSQPPREDAEVGSR